MTTYPGGSDNVAPKRRMTRQKRAIAENVLNRCDHPTAQEIHRDLDGLGIGLATVYRNLALLAEEGIITTVEHEGEVRYDCNNEPHGHASCTSCGALWDIPLPPSKGVGNPTGPLATITVVEFSLHGTCHECQ